MIATIAPSLAPCAAETYAPPARYGSTCIAIIPPPLANHVPVHSLFATCKSALSALERARPR